MSPVLQQSLKNPGQKPVFSDLAQADKARTFHRTAGDTTGHAMRDEIGKGR